MFLFLIPWASSVKVFNGVKLHFLVLSLLFSLVQSECPSDCNCTSSSVICMNKNLYKIPNLDFLDVDPIIIDFSGNRISMIDSEDFHFEKSFNVKEIYLNNSNVIDIGSGTFSEMENLQELYLANNLLNSVPSDIIENLSNMIVLDLSGNQFEGDMPIIKSRSLVVLTILNCKITILTAESLKHLPNLKMLSLVQNNVHYIDLNIFASVSNEWFSLKLPHNTWQCNCETIKTFKYLAENKYVETSEPYVCQNSTNTIKIFESLELENQFCGLEVKNLSKDNTIVKNSDENKIKRDQVSQNNSLEIFVFTNPNLSLNNTHKNNYFAVLFFLIFVIILLSLLYRLFMLKCHYTKNSESTTRLLTIN